MSAGHCPACGADLSAKKESCWLCRSPLPKGHAAPPPNFVPPPPLYLPEEDKSELDVTSIVLLVGLVAATLGAVTMGGPLRAPLGVVALVPLGYLFYWLTQGGDFTDREVKGIKTVFRVSMSIVAVIVLVPLALVVALGMLCAVVMVGANLSGR